MKKNKGICAGEDAESTDRMICRKHLAYFKKVLIAHGAPKTITDEQAKGSFLYSCSLDAFKNGWGCGVRRRNS